MPSPRKLFLNNSVVFVTFRTEEGLPFVPTSYINAVLWAVLAKAQANYPVKVCALNFEANHAHLVLYVDNPELIPLFIGYVKQESAHAINHFLGRRKKTIWAEGYDSPTLLDVNKTLEQLAYTILNPVKDNLIASMEEYPGVSSYSLLVDDCAEKRCLCITRDCIPEVPNPVRPWIGEEAILEQLRAENPTEIYFRLSPYVWKHAFSETKDLPDSEIRKLVLSKLKNEMTRIIDERVQRKLPMPNAQELKRQSLLKTYLPTKFGKRMICLGTEKSIRKKFINYYQYLHELARRVWLSWKIGDTSVPFPPGLFPPSLPRQANLYPSTAWL